jgi:kynurenine formamidase
MAQSRRTIFPEDLEAAEKDHGVNTGDGDLLFVRTGRAHRRKTVRAWNTTREGCPGSTHHASSGCTTLKIALLRSDSTSDCVPSGYDHLTRPIHTGALVMMGVHLIDNADLDTVAKTTARLGRYSFQVTIAPLILSRGTASPVNPLALF